MEAWITFIGGGTLKLTKFMTENLVREIEKQDLQTNVRFLHFRNEKKELVRSVPISSIQNIHYVREEEKIKRAP